MITNSKYIVFDSFWVEQAIVFPETMTHRQIANFVGMSKVISAGFISLGIENGGISVYPYGKSDSLEIGSRDEDVIHLRRTLGIADF